MAIFFYIYYLMIKIKWNLIEETLKCSLQDHNVINFQILQKFVLLLKF